MGCHHGRNVVSMNHHPSHPFSLVQLADVHFGSSVLILCFAIAQNLISEKRGNNWWWQTMSGILQLLVIPRQLETENQATHRNKGCGLPIPSYEFFLHFALVFTNGSQLNQSALLLHNCGSHYSFPLNAYKLSRRYNSKTTHLTIHILVYQPHSDVTMTYHSSHCITNHTPIILLVDAGRGVETWSCHLEGSLTITSQCCASANAKQTTSFLQHA